MVPGKDCKEIRERAGAEMPVKGTRTFVTEFIRVLACVSDSEMRRGEKHLGSCFHYQGDKGQGRLILVRFWNHGLPRTMTSVRDRVGSFTMWGASGVSERCY